MNLEQTPRCNPSYLGPLSDKPVVSTASVRFFEGEEKLYSKSKLDEREHMWNAVAPHLERVLDDDETVLHLLPALHVPPVFSGAFANRLDSTLDFDGNTLGWTGGHDPSEWQFGADPDQRSEWTREEAPALFVFSMPFADTVNQMEAALQQDGQTTQRTLLGGFECIRSVEVSVDDAGDGMLWVRWFVFDHDNDDLHIIAASVWPEDLPVFEPEVGELVQSAVWIPVKD